ncbi:unnamed protein product, partial [Closterium sp. NIES-54]
RLQLRERFGTDLPVLRLHFDRGGDFSYDLLQDFCRGEGILQSFTLLDSPQQNGIAEHRIGLVMEVARTSMIHAAAPHFLWPFAVWYAVDHLNLWPRVSLPETSPTVRLTGKVGNASVFWVWGSRAFVRNTSADKLSTRAIPCVFLGFVLEAPGWQFYQPTWRRVLLSQDVMFDESVPFYHLFPYRSAPPPPPPLFLAPGPPPVDPLLPQGPAPSGVSQVDPLFGSAPVQVVVGSGVAQGAASGGAGSEDARSGGAEPGGAELEGVEPGGAESEGAAPRGAASSRGAGDTGAGGAAVSTGAGGTGGTAATGPGGALTSGAGAAGTGGVGCAGAGDPMEPGAAGAGGARAGGAGVGGTGAGGAGAAGAGAVDPGARGAGGTVRQRPYFVALLQQPASSLPAPSPYTEQYGSLTERREPESRPVSPVCTARRTPHSRPPPVPITHAMAFHPSSVQQCVPLPVPPESSLPEVPDPASDRAGATCPTVSRLLATVVIDRSCESAAVPSLVAELLDFAAACRLDYATALVAESGSNSPPSVRGECALGTDVLEERQEDLQLLYLVFLPCYLPLRDTRMHQTSRPRALTQRRLRGVDYFQTFSPTPKITTVRVLVQVAAQRDYELHSLYFNTAFLLGSLHEEIWLHRPSGFTGTFLAGTQWSLRRPVYGLRQAPREWHDTLRTTLTALGFSPSTADPSLFLRTDTSLLPFYVLVNVDDLVFATADSEALTLVNSELQKRHTCTDLGELRSYLGLQITRDRARCRGRGGRVHGGRGHGGRSGTRQGPLDVRFYRRINLHEEIWLHRPSGFTGTFLAGTQWSLRRPVYGLRQAPREWHDTLRTTLTALGFSPSTADPSLFLRTDTSLLPFYVLVNVDDLVFATADSEALTLSTAKLEALAREALELEELELLTLELEVLELVVLVVLVLEALCGRDHTSFLYFA